MDDMTLTASEAELALTLLTKEMDPPAQSEDGQGDIEDLLAKLRRIACVD